MKPRVTKENDFYRDSVKPVLETIGCCLKVHGHFMQKAGWPDIIAASAQFNGAVFVELKKDTEGPSPLQRFVLTRLRKCGAKACILKPRHVVAQGGDVVKAILTQCERGLDD